MSPVLCRGYDGNPVGLYITHVLIYCAEAISKLRQVNEIDAYRLPKHPEHWPSIPKSWVEVSRKRQSLPLLFTAVPFLCHFVAVAEPESKDAPR